MNKRNYGERYKDTIADIVKEVANEKNRDCDPDDANEEKTSFMERSLE